MKPNVADQMEIERRKELGLIRWCCVCGGPIPPDHFAHFVKECDGYRHLPGHPCTLDAHEDCCETCNPKEKE